MLIVHKEVLCISILAAAGYAAYYFLAESSLSEHLTPKKRNMEHRSILRTLFQRTSGMLLYGVIPLLVMFAAFNRPMSDYGLTFKNFSPTLFWTAALIPGMALVGIVSGKHSINQEIYPQMRLSRWNISRAALSAATWGLYLSAYEFLLRGLFFFSCWRAFGLTAAVLLNMLVYGLFHLHKGAKEMTGSFVLGAVLCASVFFTRKIWPALGAHLVLALSTEWSSIHFNPDMKMKWRFRSP
ncbi:MAG: CPBP family intramembrane glutamic endopeptidase [Candidatus Aminicenantaceae bacterium]